MRWIIAAALCALVGSGAASAAERKPKIMASKPCAEIEAFCGKVFSEGEAGPGNSGQPVNVSSFDVRLKGKNSVAATWTGSMRCSADNTLYRLEIQLREDKAAPDPEGGGSLVKPEGFSNSNVLPIVLTRYTKTTGSGGVTFNLMVLGTSSINTPFDCNFYGGQVGLIVVPD